jgi:hypothetical protein
MAIAMRGLVSAWLASLVQTVLMRFAQTTALVTAFATKVLVSALMVGLGASATPISTRRQCAILLAVQMDNV